MRRVSPPQNLSNPSNFFADLSFRIPERDVNNIAARFAPIGVLNVESSDNFQQMRIFCPLVESDPLPGSTPSPPASLSLSMPRTSNLGGHFDQIHILRHILRVPHPPLRYAPSPPVCIARITSNSVGRWCPIFDFFAQTIHPASTDDVYAVTTRLHRPHRARAVRTSSLRNISLRHNKISPTGAVALALMIRDYPDVLAAPAGVSSMPSSPTVALRHLDGLPHTNTHGGNSSPILPPLLSSLKTALPLPPPRRHPATTLTAAQTTYTSYVPRRRQQSAAASVPARRTVVASSILGGVTARHVPSPTSSINPESPKAAPMGLGGNEARDREAREREKEAREQKQI
ncbi:hypothetical protein C8R47DRAFT_1221112 [Mycena vitilis]|nr:hypothetical protein C8R47DRAFT_1221112 [Mycena vitilis]